MEWGDDGLIIEAAAENAFDFKEGSPQDIDYRLRLELIKKHFQRKRVEKVTFGLMVHNVLLCIQRTLANAENVNGESVRAALNRFIDAAFGIRMMEEDIKQLTPEEQIAIYKERYRQEYGG